MTRLRSAVIPTRDRPQDFADCVAAIAPQVDGLFVIAHCPGEGEPVHPYVLDTARLLNGAGLRTGCQEVLYTEDPPNISRMWNAGLGLAHVHADGAPYDVAVLNDDVICPPDWFERVTFAMRTAPGWATAGCVYREWDRRMTGYAFILNGEAGLRADEQFQWWYGDDDLERRAQVAFAPGPDVEHRHPNSTTTGVLADIAKQDGIRFQAKWRL